MGRLICVGDRHQSIYAFRGADTQAIPRLIERLNAVILPLSVCYRCPKVVIEAAKKIVPSIEACEAAIQGEIRTISHNDLSKAAQSGDFILSRITAPLVTWCFKFLKENRKAFIRGRDIGTGLVQFLESFKETDLNELGMKIADYCTMQSQKLINQDKETEAIALQDKCDTVLVFINNSTSFDDCTAKITTLFSDDNGSGICLSTVHKAKGLEADNVFIIHPEKMPHPMAKTPEQQEQELNIKYVAITRAKKVLTFVDMER